MPGSAWARAISKERPLIHGGADAAAGAPHPQLAKKAGMRLRAWPASDAAMVLLVWPLQVLKLTDAEILKLYHFAQNEAAREADWLGIQEVEEPRKDYVALLQALEESHFRCKRMCFPPLIYTDLNIYNICHTY